MTRRRIGLVAVPLVAITLMLGYHWAQLLARRQVTARLVGLNGGPVHFKRISLGMRSLTIHGIELLEPETAARWTWCSNDRIWMDLSL